MPGMQQMAETAESSHLTPQEKIRECELGIIHDLEISKPDPSGTSSSEATPKPTQIAPTTGDQVF